MLIAMAQRFMSGVYPGALRHNPERLTSLAEYLLSSEDRLLLVATRGMAVIGMLGAMAYAHPMSGDQVVSELFWWMNPEHRGGGVRLLRALEQWAKARGADLLQMIAPTDEVARFYERLGFERLEMTYQRRLA